MGLGNSVAAIGKRPSPRKVAVTLDHCVRSSPLKGLFGIQCGVNSTENYVRSLAPRHFANLVTAQRVRGMNANPDRIARVNRRRIYLR